MAWYEWYEPRHGINGMTSYAVLWRDMDGMTLYGRDVEQGTV